MLYKYAPWQEKDNENHTKKNIENSALYFNTPDGFNDPFDNTPSYNISSESQKVLLHCFLQDNRNLSDTFTHVDHNLLDRTFKDVFKQVDYDKLNNAKRGITCFSRNNANILMWSHYANNHSGVCLGFDIDKNDEHLGNFLDETRNQKLFLNTKACRLLPIKYVSFDERPSIDMTDERKSWAEILTFKSNLWEYEQEERIMIYNNEHAIFPRTLCYKPYCLKEIICGANMNLSTFIKLKNCIDKLPNANGISIFLATLSESNYELFIKRLDFDALQMINKNYSYLYSNDKKLKRSFTYELKKIWN